jgi:hypothetical protein
MHHSIDLAFVYLAFVFMPLKEAKNIAPGVNPGFLNAYPIHKLLKSGRHPLSSTNILDHNRRHGFFCHSFGVSSIFHMNPGLTPGAIIIGPFRAV